jgi:hypothetical protein
LNGVAVENRFARSLRKHQRNAWSARSRALLRSAAQVLKPTPIFQPYR